ncbi:MULTISPECIES: dihydrofolate reductase family protein [unclassified Nocardioides]|uniref:dihydrofolate reductase family protein n=1 Tax=unclassified Nocardioides TaxID=2615069 RepID=UPI0009EFFF0B|nr:MULTISPECIES: dihydrofolate reductase family protein [unclassified Nocardioides]GAW48489.1 Bifunctional deaminase-reductase domain protein [Nocardioides sp. PD653-B2]GAW52816.1 Bifunctional deaminase-reductase domain protein [Nocardioides sp. PD653]
MSLRVLIGPETDDLAELYAVPRTPWLRANMVSTVDGAATGESGKSGSINNAADKRVFDQLRESADAIVVGAGTARTEGYRPTSTPTVVVSRQAAVPETLRGAPTGSVLMATCGSAEHLGEARKLLGDHQVLVLGSHRVDLPLLKQVLADRGWTEVLSEGGPHLLRDLLASGAADEVCATVVPRMLAGEHPRITQGPPVDVPLDLHTLIESEGTLLGRWFVARS